MIWVAKHPLMTAEMLGFIPDIITDSDTRSVKDQVNAKYGYGGGWTPFEGFTMLPDGSLSYPGDPPLPLLAEAQCRDETVRFYDCSWVCVIQADGSWEVCRMD